LTDKDILALIWASTIMIERHQDIKSSVELIECANRLSGPKKMAELMLELNGAHSGSRKEIKECRAGMVLSAMTPQQSIREEN